MLVETENSVYELRPAEQSYRRVSREEPRGLSAWQHYDRLGPIRTGEPMTFFIAGESSGRSLAYEVVTTSPVTQVRAA